MTDIFVETIKNLIKCIIYIKINEFEVHNKNLVQRPINLQKMLFMQ